MEEQGVVTPPNISGKREIIEEWYIILIWR
jgi:hypothetical protein